MTEREAKPKRPPSILPSEELRRLFAEEIANAKIEIVEDFHLEIRRVDRNTAIWKAFFIGVLAAMVGTVILEQGKHINMEQIIDQIRHSVGRD